VKILLPIILAMLSPSPSVTTAVEAVAEKIERIQEEFKTTPQGFLSCLTLSARTGIPFDVCVRILQRESGGGKRGAMRLCRRWGRDASGDWSCPGGYYSVYHGGWNLPESTIRAQACEVSEWQLRHSPSWSWIRKHNRLNDTDYDVTDMEDFNKSLEVMETAYFALKHTAEEEGPRCIATKRVCTKEGLIEGAECLRMKKVCTRTCPIIPGAEDLVWLQYWNGCASYRAHVKAVLSYREKQGHQ